MSSELALLGEIVVMAGDEDGDLGEFSARVASSPRLAAGVTRVANSVLYGMSGKIDRLDRAVLILGRRTIAGIAATTAVSARLADITTSPVDVDALWHHALSISQGARLLAALVEPRLESEVSLVGLLHDLAIPEVCDLTGTGHADTLAAQAKDWGFPELLCDAIAAHHDPDRPDGDVRRIATLVRAAHGLVLEEPGFDDDWPGAEESSARFHALGIDADDVDALRADLKERLAETTGVLGSPGQGNASR